MWKLSNRTSSHCLKLKKIQKCALKHRNFKILKQLKTNLLMSSEMLKWKKNMENSIQVMNGHINSSCDMESELLLFRIYLKLIKNCTIPNLMCGCQGMCVKHVSFFYVFWIPDFHDVYRSFHLRGFQILLIFFSEIFVV